MESELATITSGNKNKMGTQMDNRHAGSSPPLTLKRGNNEKANEWAIRCSLEKILFCQRRASDSRFFEAVATDSCSGRQRCGAGIVGQAAHHE